MNRNDTTKTSFDKQCDTIKHNIVRKTNTTTPGANITAVVDASSSHAVGAPVAILDEPAVEELTSLSRTTRWRMERRGEFPRRVRLSPGRVGWRQAEIEAWIRSRTA
jgi:prophage regulatory protein